VKKPIRVIPQPSQSQAQSARDRKCATVMLKLLNKWYTVDLVNAADRRSALSQPISFPAELNLPDTIFKISCVSATPVMFGPMVIRANLKRGSLATWETRYTPSYLKGVMDDLKKVRGNKSAGDEKNGVVPVLQEQGNPCGDCPFRHGASAGANSLREAFKAVSKRAEKRIKKTGEVK